MTRLVLSLVAGLSLAVMGCSSGPGSDAGTGGGKGGGNGSDGGSRYTITTVDSQAQEPRYLSAAADSQGRIGIAYFSKTGDGGMALLPDGGPEPVTNYDLYYLQFNNGTASAREKIATVQRVYGVSLAFQPSGEPAVAYLGGGSDMSAYWFQSDAVVSFRNGGTWTTETAVTMGDEANCGSPVSDRGFVVGLFPSLVFIGNTAYLAYRDGHDGQFPQQDWAGSDLELATRTGPNAWSTQCLIAGGDNKQAWGGHNRLINAGGRLAVSSDKMFGGADTTASNVIFNYVQADGGWSAPQSVLAVANTQSGPTLAWDSQEKFGLASINKSIGTLYMMTSMDGRTWSSPDPVFGSGSGGWYPSLAWDPIYHEPAIAFYICDSRVGQNEGTCPTGEDKLVISQRNSASGQWREEDVDLEGGTQLQLGFFASGKRWVAYRDPRSGAVKVAIEK